VPVVVQTVQVFDQQVARVAALGARADQVTHLLQAGRIGLPTLEVTGAVARAMETDCSFLHQVSLETVMVGNREEKSLALAAILMATWRAMALYRAAT